MRTVELRGPQRITAAYPDSWTETYELITDRREPVRDDALRRCIEVAADAQTVVFEDDYYDVDYRSEYSLLHSKEFTPPSAHTTRVHFFRDVLDPADLTDGLDARVEDLDGDGRPGYLGYMILRPLEYGVVGRTMLAPPPSVGGIDDVPDEVRTAVREVVTLLGQQLPIAAVPFMEQDGHLLTCAHVTSWMCHYTAVLNKWVPRRPVAEFAVLAGELSFNRRYPSLGLVMGDIVQLMERIDLPPIAVQFSELLTRAKDARTKRDTWSRRPKTRWTSKHRLLTEELTAEICRYLNSGLPCLLGIDDHQVLVCGYHRTTAADGRSVTELIYHDDQLGPYRVLPVPDRVLETDTGRLVAKKKERRAHSLQRVLKQRSHWGPSSSDTSVRTSEQQLRMWHQLILPAPRGVRTSGAHAESAAGDYALSFLDVTTIGLTRLIRELSEDPPDGEDDATNRMVIDTARLFRSHATELRALIHGRRIALRTYATTGVSFKTKYAIRCSEAGGAVDADPRAIEAIRGIPLPKYIWVTELMDRTLRDSDSAVPAVLGEIVMDASATPTDPNVILLHVPGLFAYSMPASTNEWIGESNTSPDDQDMRLETRSYTLGVAPGMRYHTGRPSLKYDPKPGVPGQSKGAVSGTSFYFT